MEISIELQKLLKERGVCVTEACDVCGRILGAVRFTHTRSLGAWCSRQCRDGLDAHAPGTCLSCGASFAGLRRGTKFCSAVCRVRFSRKSQTFQISRNAQLKTQDLQAGLEVLATTAHSRAVDSFCEGLEVSKQLLTFRTEKEIEISGGEVSVQQRCSDEAALEDWLRSRGGKPWFEGIVLECVMRFPRLDRFQVTAVILKLRDEDSADRAAEQTGESIARSGVNFGSMSEAEPALIVRRHSEMEQERT